MATRRTQTFDPATTIDIAPADIDPPPEVGLRPEPMPPPPPRRPTSPAARISGLAGLCMLVLIVAGLGLPLPGGHLAVDAVLVVVGLQLGLAVTGAAERGGRWAARFWIRALAPIVVPTAVAVALATAYWWWLDRLGSAEVAGALTSAAMVGNLAALDPGTRFAATDHLWLVALVAQFALLAPIAVLVARRSDGPRPLVRGLIALVAVVVTTRLTLLLTGLTDDSIRSLAIVTRVDGLLIGLGLAAAPASMLERIPRTVAAPAFTGLLVIFALAPDPTGLPVVTLGLLGPMTALATAAIVATRLTDNPSDALARILGSLGLRWLGARAISIYVWHQLFGMALDDTSALDLFGADWPGSSLFTTRLVFALAAGAASYRYLQLPLRALAGRRWRRRPSPTDRPLEPTGHTAFSPG